MISGAVMARRPTPAMPMLHVMDMARSPISMMWLRYASRIFFALASRSLFDGRVKNNVLIGGYRKPAVVDHFIF